MGQEETSIRLGSGTNFWMAKMERNIHNKYISLPIRMFTELEYLGSIYLSRNRKNSETGNKKGIEFSIKVSQMMKYQQKKKIGDYRVDTGLSKGRM